jgi:hypothetical protein
MVSTLFDGLEMSHQKCGEFAEFGDSDFNRESFECFKAKVQELKETAELCTVVHLIADRHLIAGTPPNLTQMKIWEYLKMETLIEHD